MGCNQSTDAAHGTTTDATDTFRERRNRLRDSRKRGPPPTNQQSTSVRGRRAAAAAIIDAADQAVRSNKSAFPSSRDIPGFVNPLAGVVSHDVLSEMREPNPSIGVTIGNTSTAATNAATLGAFDQGSYYATDEVIETMTQDEDQQAVRQQQPATRANFNESGESIGRLADVPEVSSDPAAPHRRLGMDEHAHPSLDTANHPDGSAILLSANPQQRVVASSRGPQLSASPRGTPELLQGLIPQPADVARQGTPASDDVDAVLGGTGSDSTPYLTVVTLTMHRRRMRALAAAAAGSSSATGSASAAGAPTPPDVDPMNAWLEEVILMTVSAPHLRVKIVEAICDV